MKINEVEKILEIPKATIRFYEKEGLIAPKRNENAYREYSKDDIDVLKKIVVLRKIGVPVDDIKLVLNGRISLQEMLSKNMTELHAQMEETKGAIKVCALMQKKEEDITTFDKDYYWKVIHVEEENGQSFFDVAKDYLQFEYTLLDEVTGGGDKTLLVIATIFLISAIVRGVVSYFTGTGFWSGFLGLFVVFVIVSVIWVPVYLLRKNEKAVNIYIRLVRGLAGSFLILVLLLLVVLLLNTKLHFLF